MTEEKSMTAFLRQVLPAAFPKRSEKTDWLLIDHRGKTALETALPKKIRGWREPDIRFLIVRDNDGANCRDTKSKLTALVPNSPRRLFRVRIVCQELESWILGDPEAIVAAYPSAGRHPSFKAWTRRDPDKLTNASELVAQLTKTRAKVTRAEAIAKQIDPRRNRSHSFQVFLDGLQRLFSPSR